MALLFGMTAVFSSLFIYGAEIECFTSTLASFSLGSLDFVICSDEQMAVYQLIGRDVILRHDRMSTSGKPPT